MPNDDHTDYDVIVVGAGGSGLACAAEAAARGAKVLVVEKAPKIGGTTSWAVGAYTSSATPHQQRAGVNDDPDRHFTDMDLVNASANRPDNLGLRRLMTREAPDTFRWLMELGVEFIGPNPESPHTRPRMHNIVPGAQALIYYLGRQCRRLEVTIQCNSSLDDIVMENGRACGVVVASNDGTKITYRAVRGIVLASGDFAASKDMRARYFDQAVVNAEPVYPYNTGDGLKIVERLGGHIVNGDYTNFYIPRMRFVPPAKASWVLRLPPSRLVARLIQIGWSLMPQALMRPFIMQFVTTVLGPEPNLFKQGAALVNVSGKLLDVDLASIARNLALDTDNRGFIVFDSQIAKRFDAWPNFISTAPGIAYAYLSDYRKSRHDIYFDASTIESLAIKIGAEPEALRQSIGKHNLLKAPGERVEMPPYYALGPVRGYINVTEGGLAVTDDLAVLGRNDKPIPGLFAAGSAGQGGVLLDGHGHHITWACVSGRHAARSVLGVTTPKDGTSSR
jgi:succinate dehydrogenase/fumarate reductase flavoprotein subunit